MRKTLVLPVVAILASVSFFSACARQELQNPFQPGLSGWIAPEVKNRILSGAATSDDLSFIIAKFNENNQVAQVEGTASYAVMTVPETGRLQLTLQDSDAGWKSDVFMTIGNETIPVFSAAANGPQTFTSAYAYPAGTTVGFFIVTYAPNGEVITNAASGEACTVEYYASVPKWVLNFKNVPVQANKGGSDKLTGTVNLVINVQMAAEEVVDVSDCFDVSVDYLDPWGYTDEGYAIYFIGETMFYNVNVGVVQGSALFQGNTFAVYAIQEYFDDETCYRWWYPGEPKEITVKKGDPLPGQNPPQSWKNVSFVQGQTVVLNGSHTCPLSVAAGNDQTHVIIVSENDQGQILMTLYDNPVAGVYDPPPAPVN
jgi:hypothetical protein